MPNLPWRPDTGFSTSWHPSRGIEHSGIVYSTVSWFTRDSAKSADVSFVGLVVASQSGDNTTWLNGELPSWTKIVYVTDSADAEFAVPVNKGRESMVYLSYIIDHYTELPEVVVFSHANRYQWHNDDPWYDGLRVLSRLNLSYVKEQGYSNLRCVWTLGCPVEIRPLLEAEDDMALSNSYDAGAGSFYKAAFEVLFPGVAVPEAVGVTCCAQFAVTAEAIRQRPRDDYERYREWLMESELHDGLTGRITEYSWHVIFGREPIFCPSAKHCYCRLHGLCNVTCEGDGVCREYYTLPDHTHFPDGWPEVDRQGQWQNITRLRDDYERMYPH
ncbi:hypothetical protein M409DRAFT_71666 [Zasmidium cellare ATCC 36951]|uniref:Uncharacterized protein n=1 Tax=Zasmidium cellare ATCC 36951 TaxID=1080233 RepID=A0A6A6BV60_ZASCE|nr:uncharacterized protein M409DRAFT_71666 [Zasmidium cellare ATCC 36951]KAF2158403.1 hypothetical protein M409DRAFT_71666 [Zasmidium cellare ATCC 36951]